jgi:hypothetical protein
MYYLWDASSETVLAASKIYAPSYYYQHSLPGARCHLNDHYDASVPLPRMGNYIDKYLKEIHALNLQPNIKEIIDVRANAKRVKRLIGSRISIEEFRNISPIITKLLDLPEGFPVVPGARIARLRMRRMGRKKFSIAYHDDSAWTRTVDSETALKLLDQKFLGVELYRCLLEPTDEERYELSIEGFGELQATQSDVESYYETKIEWRTGGPTFVRCSECHQLIWRPYLSGSGYAIHSQADFLRLRDFGGIYVSQRARDFLEEIAPNQFIFLTV